MGWSDHNRTVHIIFLYFDFLRDCFDLSIIGFACAISYLMKIMTKNLMRIVLDYRGEKKCIENMFSGSTFCNPANLGGKGSRKTQTKKWSPHFQLFMAWIFTFILIFYINSNKKVESTFLTFYDLNFHFCPYLLYLSPHIFIPNLCGHKNKTNNFSFSFLFPLQVKQRITSFFSSFSPHFQTYKKLLSYFSFLFSQLQPKIVESNLA